MMDVNTAPSVQLSNGDQSNKKIKLTPFIVVPPTSSFVKLEDSLLKGIGNHLATSNVNAINTTSVNTSSANLLTAAAVKLTGSNGTASTVQNLSMANLNSLPVFTTNPNQSNNSTSTVSTFANGQIAIATSKPGDKTALTQTTNYLMLNGLTAGNMLSGQFIESAANGQARGGLNSICINKLSSAQNGTANSAGPNSTSNGQVNSGVALTGASSQSALDAINGSAANKVSVQYLSVSYNNSGNISITNANPSSAANLAALNGNGAFTINSADLQQQILNTLKSSDLNLGLLKSFVPATTISNSTQPANSSSTSNSKQSKTSSSVPSTNSNFANGPTTNCDQPATSNLPLNLEPDCQLTVNGSPVGTQGSLNLANSLTSCLLNSSSNQHSNNADADDKQHIRIEAHSPLNEGALTDFDIKTLNSHNLLNAANRLLISPTDFLTLTEDHNNNVSSNQTSSTNWVRNSAVKRDVSLSSGCLSSNVELLRKSSNYLGSLNNSFIGFERFCESPLFIDHHRDMHLLDDDEDDDELKDVNKEFINSEDLFFGTSLSDGQNLDQSQLDQLVFILDHQQPEPGEPSNAATTNSSSTADPPANGNNCVVILDINQQQSNQNSSNKVTVKTEPGLPVATGNSNNNQTSAANSNSVLLNCLTSNSNLLNKTSHQQLSDSLLQLSGSESDLSGPLLTGQATNSKLIDGIKYIIHQNDTGKLDGKHKDGLIKINNLPAYLTNSGLENGQLIVNMNSADKSKLLNSDSLGTQAVLIQHTGGRANSNLNRQSLLTGSHLNATKINGNANSHPKGNSAIKQEVHEPIVQIDLPNIKTEKPDHSLTSLSAGDLDLTNLFGKNTTNISVNVSVAQAEDSAVSSTTNGNGSKNSKTACSPDSSSGGQLGSKSNLNATNSFLSFQNSTNSANNLVNNSMAILTNGDTNSTNNSNSTTSHLTSCTPALVANSGNGSTYTLLPTGLLQLAANIAAVFPSSNVQKQVALQLLREDGSSLIVPIVPARNPANQNSNGNLSGNSSAINQDGNASGSMQTSMPQATQLITISADSLNNLIQGGLNGNVIATITTGQTPTNPTVISTSLGPGSSSTTSSTTSIGNDQDRPFKCDLCNATFTRLGNFTRHKKIHSLPSKVSHLCRVFI